MKKLTTQQRYDANEALAQKRRFGLSVPKDAIEYQTPLNDQTDTPIQSTASYRNETKDKMARLEQIKQQALDIQAKLEARKAKESLSQNQTVQTKDQSFDIANDPFADIDTFRAAKEKEYENEVRQIQNDYDSMQRLANQEYRSLINGIKQQFQTRMELMRDTNDRVLKAQRVNNIRSGVSRYAAEMAAGLMTEQEQQGHLRLMEIESEMNSLLADAAKAKQEGDLKAFNDYYDKINDAYDRMHEQIKENFNEAVKRNEEIRKNNQEIRLQEAQEFKQKLEKSKRAAKVLAQKLVGLPEEEQAAVVEEYAKVSGIPLAILMGDLYDAAAENRLDEMKLKNIENQIYNRNRSTDLQYQREARLAAKSGGSSGVGETGLSDYTQNIIDEAQVLGDVPTKERAKVIAELRSLGLYNELPPQWYIDYVNEEANQTLNPDDVKAKWEEFRRKATDTTGSGEA